MPPAKRKAAVPVRRQETRKKAAQPSQDFAEDFARWLPFARDTGTAGKSPQWRAYFEMRRDYPGMPMLLEHDESSSDDEDSAEVDPEPEGLSDGGDKQEPAPTGGEEAGEEPESQPADAVGEVDDDGDDDDEQDDDDDADAEGSAGGASDDEWDENEHSDSENGEEVDLGRDELDACMRRPALQAARQAFASADPSAAGAASPSPPALPEAFLSHLAVMVDKIYLRERCQTLQTCIRAYALAKMEAVDVKMEFHHKLVGDAKQHVFNVYMRSVDADQMVEQLPKGSEWRPVYKSFIDADARLNAQLCATKDALEGVRQALLGGSTLEHAGASSGGEVGAAELFFVLFAAAGSQATEWVSKYSEGVVGRVRALFDAKAPVEPAEPYDERGPAFDDPFDAEDYPVPEEGCAQQ